MHSCLVRKLLEKDIPIVSGLYKKMYLEQKTFGMVFSLRQEEIGSILSSQLKSRLHYIKVLECDGNLYGFIAASLIKLQRKYTLGENDFVGFINDLYVDPVLRCQGHAEKLLEAVEKEMRQAGIRHLELHVLQGNFDGIRFWNKNGFKSMMQVMYKSMEEE